MPRPILLPVSEWSDPRHRLGLAGELAALAYLSGAGWLLEAHRYRVGRNDIDLVMRRGDVVAFIEVKTRRSTVFGSGGTAVGWRKRRVLARVAEVWRIRHGRGRDLYRFDLCEVVPHRWRSPEVTHTPNAWRSDRLW
jgi:putative endonuclease